MPITHTPGPWRIQGNGTLNHPVSGRPLTTVRFETSLGTFEVLDETNEPDANAQLIAAAPDLLHALEQLFEHCSMIHKHWGDGCNQKQADAAIKAGRAAIAKAGGAQ